uniref:Putative terminase n=1 Tax=viral metagenome TaxID=1070528 RepID=A0A6M3IPJ1_9ZZZZ
MDKAEALALKLRFETSFIDFVKYFCAEYLTSEIPEFHKEAYSLLPTEPRIAIASPRGHGKSTICSVFYPIWLGLFQKRQDITIISASEGLAIEWLRKIKRELEINRRIIAFFGELKSDKWTENHIILKNSRRVNIRARGAGSQIRGFRPDCLICDDLETNESVESEEQRKKLKDWIFRDCLNTLMPEGQFIIIGTIIHPLSVLSDLLAVDNGWVKKKYQAYIDGRQEAGNELWGSLWSHEKLQQRKREIGSWAFASEYMNNPVSDETVPIKEDQIRYWKEFPQTYSSVLAVDPAYSDDEKSDFKVVSHIAIDQQMNRYLASYVRTHSPIGEFQDAIINLWLQNKNTITAVGIPNSGVEKSFFDSFLKKCEERKLYPPVVELKNAFTQTGTSISIRGKKARVTAALQPLFEQGKYFINPDHIEARDELLTIGSSRWDDIVDTMAYGESILTPSYYTMEQPKKDYEEEFKPNKLVFGYGD